MFGQRAMVQIIIMEYLPSATLELFLEGMLAYILNGQQAASAQLIILA